MTSAPAVRPSRRTRHPGARQEARAAYGFVAPNLVFLVVFVLGPLVGAVLLSFQRTNGFGEGSFVGLANYARLVGDPLFWRSVVNTLVFTVIVAPASMLFGLGIAVLLDTVLPGRALFRSIVILPMTISGVATALMGGLVFDQNTGVLDALLRSVGLPAVPWQSNGVAAFASIVVVTLWWRVGFNMLIYLAALQGIDRELYEAALLDGANVWQRFWYVTVPQVRATSFFLVVLNVIYSFQVFDIVFVMTGGGPQNATSVLVTYAYDQGFVTRDQGYAAAIGMVLLLASLAFALVQWRINRRSEVEA